MADVNVFFSCKNHLYHSAAERTVQFYDIPLNIICLHLPEKCASKSLFFIAFIVLKIFDIEPIIA